MPAATAARRDAAGMSRATRWAFVVALLAVIGVALVLAFVLSYSSADGGFYERQVVWLFWVNAAVAVLLALVLVAAGVRLAVRLKRGKFGSRLLLKLAGIFALVGLLPGLVIYTVSYQFAARSIQAWFDVRLASALDAGLALGKGTLELMQADLADKAGVAAARLSEAHDSPTTLTLERLREQIGADEAVLFNAAGTVLAQAGQPGGVAALVLAPERPAGALWRQLRTAAQGRAAQIEGLDDEQAARAGGAHVRALARVPDSAVVLPAPPERYLMLVRAIPGRLAADALAVQAANSEYQQRAIAREAMRRMYIGTLTLALILAVFGAVLLTIMLGNQIARPLLLLADGVREVAAGNLSAKPVFASGDELGGLTRSFAAMTQQVADARAEVQRGAAQLQTIMDNLTAGVVLFDADGGIAAANPAATRILRAPLQALQGQPLDAVPELQAFAQLVSQRFDTLRSAPEPGERGQWQDSFELPHGTHARDVLTLMARGALLDDGTRLLVFDDITDIVSAQRSQAWGEVARRLAHEIKNPLTPIQLSAERLQHRLEAKLDAADQAMLGRSVATIVAQVQAMKDLVNEFRDYARLPAAQLTPLALNELVHDVLGLYAQAQEQGRLTAQLEDGLALVQGDASQLRQVIHNLVQNALDAVQAQPDGRVGIFTEAVRGSDGVVQAVRLAVQDNGPGFAEAVLKRAFEPYVTTKPKGTGLGLAVVKKIADEHRAQVRVRNLGEGDAFAPRGARVSISFSLLHTPSMQPAARDA